MKRRFTALAALLSVSLCMALSLPLRVKNLNTYSYQNVPVQFGVPFPEGALSAADVSKLTVSVEATQVAIPAGIAKTVVWHDGSVRWVRLIFPATVGPTGTVNYVLSNADKNTLGGLSVTQGANAVTVNTGVLKFTVKGANFNLIDEAWSNEDSPGVFDAAHQVVETGNQGGFYIKIGSTEYKSNTSTATVTLVESTKYHALVRATGKIGSYVYTVYYYAYDQKPYIKMTHNFYYDNSDGTSAGRVNITDLSLRVMTKVTGGSAAFSGTTGDVTTTVSGTDEALLYYVNEDAYVVRNGATTLGSGKGVNEGTQGAQNVGWAHMANGTLGVGACVRWMWQMAPKNISLHGTGETGVHLYSNKGSALEFYGGTGRTHFTGFAFTKSVDAVKEMFYAICQPLPAVAPTQWLTGQTRVMGNLVPCEAAVLQDNVPRVLNNYRMMGFLFGHSKRRTVIDGEDSYGFLELGDLNEPPMDCGGRYWANNYYDFPHCIAQAFMMTGSEYNIETAAMHALHLGDMDHSNVTGQSRTCPGWGNFGDYTRCAVGFSPTANHYKCQGLFDWACILAEPMLGDLGLRVAQWAKGYPGGELRATGHVLQSLAGAYGYTNDAQWKTSLENAYSSMGVSGAAVGQSSFMQAILAEGLMWTIIEDPGFQTAKTILGQWADHWVANYNSSTHSYIADYPTLSGWLLGPLGFAVKENPAKLSAYSPSMTDLWGVWSTSTSVQGEGKIKTFTQQFRGTPHYFHLVTRAGYNVNDPDYWNMTASVNTPVEGPADRAADFDLQVCPNPFNPAVTISVYAHRRGDPAGRPYGLAIYDTHGRMVHRVSDLQSGTYTWHAAGLPAGIYLLRAHGGRRTLTKKLFLVK